MYSVPLRVIFLGLVIISCFSSPCVADRISSFNINPFQVIPLLAVPLRQQIAVSDSVLVLNDGSGVTVSFDTIDKRSFSRGGIIGNDVYTAYQIRYNFNATVFGTAGVTFNGFGTPLVVDAFFFNAKYGSAFNATSFPDGIVVFRDSVRIGAPNFFFPPFEAVLNQIQQLGGYSKSNIATCVNFFYPIGIRTYYYSYKALYTITFYELPVKYGTATIIATPLQYTQSISFYQFNAFQRLLVGGQTSLTTNVGLIEQPKSLVYLVGGLVSPSIVL